MQYYDINIAPGAVRRINAPGGYIYFLSGSAGGADTTILVRNESGSEAIKLKPGQAFRLPVGGQYLNWIISNFSGAGTIIGELLIGEGDYFDNRISGTVDISGVVSVAGAVAVNDVIGSGTRMDTFAGALTVGANQVTTHITPAANVNGIICRAGSLITQAGVGGGAYVNAKFMFAAAAPASLSGSQSNALMVFYGSNQTTNSVQSDIPIMNRRIPAGWGLYSITSVAVGAAGGAHMTLSYELL